MHKAELAGLASKEPTHQVSPTRWNSTHEMGSDAINKHIWLDLIMALHVDDISIGALSDEQWARIGAVTAFLHMPHHVIKSLAADHKISLDLVVASITHLIKHCECEEAALQAIDGNLMAASMKETLKWYEKVLVQEPVTMAAYLDP